MMSLSIHHKKLGKELGKKPRKEGIAETNETESKHREDWQGVREKE